MSQPTGQSDAAIARRVLASEPRSEILRYLATGSPANYGTILNATNIAGSSLSWHLRELEDAGVITGDVPHGQRRGRSVNYTLDRDRFNMLVQNWIAYLTNT